MTGTRDKTVVEALSRVGAKIGNSVSKNTLVLIASDKTETSSGRNETAERDLRSTAVTDAETVAFGTEAKVSGKMTDAQKLNIPIMTPDEFMAKYFS